MANGGCAIAVQTSRDIELDLRAVRLRTGHHEQMDLVGSEKRAFVADAGQVERLGCLLRATGFQNTKLSIGAAAREDIVHLRYARALDKTVDEVLIATSGRALPLDKLCRGTGQSLAPAKVIAGLVDIRRDVWRQPHLPVPA